MTTSLLLDRSTWDCCLDAGGNIAVCAAPYAVAQDVACAIRLFRGDLWYGPPTAGVPYFESILGQQSTRAFLKSQFIAAALTVPPVVSAICYLDSLDGRNLSGQVQVTTAAGDVLAAGFGAGSTGGSPFILGHSTLGGGDVI